MIEPVASFVPFGVGNHEHDYNRRGMTHYPSGAVKCDDELDYQNSLGPFFRSTSSGECFLPLYHRFHAPDKGCGVFWCSSYYGTTSIVQTSSEHDWRRNLEFSSLSKRLWTQRKVARLVVSFQIRMELKDSLRKYNVTVLITGHKHSYERTCRTDTEYVSSVKGHVVADTPGESKADTSSLLGKWGFVYTGHIQFWFSAPRCNYCWGFIWSSGDYSMELNLF